MLLAEQRKTAALKVGEGAVCAGSRQRRDHGTPGGACHRHPVDGDQAQRAEMNCSTSLGTGETDSRVPALHASDGQRGWQGSVHRRGGQGTEEPVSVETGQLLPVCADSRPLCPEGQSLQHQGSCGQTLPTGRCVLRPLAPSSPSQVLGTAWRDTVRGSQSGSSLQKGASCTAMSCDAVAHRLVVPLQAQGRAGVAGEPRGLRGGHHA